MRLSEHISRSTCITWTPGAKQAHAKIIEKNRTLKKELATAIRQQEQITTAMQAMAIHRAKEQTCIKQATAICRAREQAHVEQAHVEQAHAKIIKKNRALKKELTTAHDKIAQQEQTITAKQATAIHRTKEPMLSRPMQSKPMQRVSRRTGPSRRSSPLPITSSHSRNRPALSRPHPSARPSSRLLWPTPRSPRRTWT